MKPTVMMRLIKIDEEKRIVVGRATEEIADKADEILDYASSKPEFEKWSSEIEKASKGKSKGNVREMHGNKVAGTVQQILFLDAEKAIDIEVKVVADDAWKLVKEGAYTGFSIGGSYVRKWKDPDNPDLTRFTPRVVEVSLVDSPCVPTATFEAVKADGTTEIRKFKPREEAHTAMEPQQVWKSADGKTFATKAECAAHNESVAANGVVQPAADALAKLDAALKVKEGEKEEDKEKDKEEDEEDQDEVTPKKEEEEDEGKNKKVNAIAALKKSLNDTWDARQAIEALVAIECLLMGEECDDEVDEDQIADLEEAVARIKAFISAEIMEDSEKAAKADELKKLLPADKHQLVDAIKAGARHSKGDTENLKTMSEHVQKMQDHHDAIGESMTEVHKCMKGLGMEGHDMEEEGDTNQKMAKLAAQNTAMTEMLAKAVTAIDTLPALLAAKDTQIDELQKRVKVVENTPLPRKSAGEYKPVEKGHEQDDAGNAVEAPYKTPNRTSPAEERARRFNR